MLEWVRVWTWTQTEGWYVWTEDETLAERDTLSVWSRQVPTSPPLSRTPNPSTWTTTPSSPRLHQHEALHLLPARPSGPPQNSQNTQTPEALSLFTCTLIHWSVQTIQSLMSTTWSDYNKSDHHTLFLNQLLFYLLRVDRQSGFFCSLSAQADKHKNADVAETRAERRRAGRHDDRDAMTTETPSGQEVMTVSFKHVRSDDHQITELMWTGSVLNCGSTLCQRAQTQVNIQYVFTCVCLCR